MAEFLSENYGSIIVGAALIVIIALIIRKLVRDKRAGKGCCGSCSACGKGCPQCSRCSGSVRGEHEK